MSDSVLKNFGKVIQIDEDQIREHLGGLVRGSVEETLNKFWMLKLINCVSYKQKPHCFQRDN